MNGLDYFHVDVFTNTAFGGNPLAVFPEAGAIPESALQAIAAEINFSETVFVYPPASSKNHARLRIFTPRAELPFAGHPNIGAAFALLHHGCLTADRGELRFEQQAGLVQLRRLDDGAMALQAPAAFAVGSHLPEAEVAAMLQLDASELSTAAHPPMIASAGNAFLLVELCGADALARACGDATAIARWLPADQATGILCYYREAAGSAASDGVIHARMFAPAHGIDEDPATGSAACVLAGLLASLLPEPASGEWFIVQGEAMGRPSQMVARATLSMRSVVDIAVSGHSVSMARGVWFATGD